MQRVHGKYEHGLSKSGEDAYLLGCIRGDLCYNVFSSPNSYYTIESYNFHNEKKSIESGKNPYFPHMIGICTNQFTLPSKYCYSDP